MSLKVCRIICMRLIFWKNGEQIFDGTFFEAKASFG